MPPRSGATAASPTATVDTGKSVFSHSSAFLVEDSCHRYTFASLPPTPTASNLKSPLNATTEDTPSTSAAGHPFLSMAFCLPVATSHRLTKLPSVAEASVLLSLLNATQWTEKAAGGCGLKVACY